MKPSQAASSVEHILENRAQVEFAQNTLSEAQFEALMKSRKQLWWFQIFPWIPAVIVVICVLLFVPPEVVPNGYAGRRETFLLFGAAGFLLFYTFWLVLSQFVVGKLWHKYARWYRKEGSVEELYGLFEQ